MGSQLQPSLGLRVLKNSRIRIKLTIWGGQSILLTGIRRLAKTINKWWTEHLRWARKVSRKQITHQLSCKSLAISEEWTWTYSLTYSQYMVPIQMFSTFTSQRITVVNQIELHLSIKWMLKELVLKWVILVKMMELMVSQSILYLIPGQALLKMVLTSL